MCGFVGFLTNQGTGLEDPQTVVRRMASTIKHRGPDDSGSWFDLENGIAMAHRRLAIVDLTPAGHQPMHSANGRFVLAFNGEVYNHLEIRSKLSQVGSAPAWRGHSDTETLLSAIECWGVEVALNHVVGMFAIALWDLHTRTLYLARDRFGEKPLYYGWVGDVEHPAFVFGSELKALRAYPSFSNTVSRESLALYMRFTYVPTPYSIYEHIFKLEPGCVLSVNGPIPPASTSPLRPKATHFGLTVRRWWSLSEVVESSAPNMLMDEGEVVDELERSLREAVQLQSLADVPLGAFLSGGVDSSLIVALMQQNSTQRIKTFTVGFEDAAFDESGPASLVAKHLGTEHAELFVTADETRSVVPLLPAMYDEPFADSSQVPTHLLCRAARQHVTVALSGDAGDELFGGYNRYVWGPLIWRRMSWLPKGARSALGMLLQSVPGDIWDLLNGPVNAVLSQRWGVARIGDKAHKLGARLRDAGDLEDIYYRLVSEWQDPAQVVKGEGRTVQERMTLLADQLPVSGVELPELVMMYRDTMTYLPDDILCKVDRAAMAVGLETRIPFLDHRVAELAWHIPLQMKIRGREGKWALRQVLSKFVPNKLIDRPKAGFGIPVGAWLRGPLRDWAETLLDEKRLDAEGYFHSGPIRREWAEHLNGRRDHTGSLWTVLMFQAWLEAEK